MQKRTSVIWILLVAMVCACSGNKGSLLETAAQCVETAPAKALACLDSIREPGRLGKDGLADYYFLRWHATFLRDGKLGNTLPSTEAAAYWEKKKDYRKAAWTWIYCSIKQQRWAEPGEAALCLDKAQRLAAGLQDSLLAFYVHYCQGRLLFRNRAFPEGVEAFRQAIAHSPQAPQADVTPYWLKAAECYLYTGDYKSAENCYRRVKACLEKGTHSPSTIHDIFRSVRKVRNAQVKEELLEDWTKYFKEDAYALTCCRLVEAAAFLQKGEMDSARICLKEAQAGLSARTPELSLAFYKMQGRYYFRCGEYEQAARTYRRHLHLSDSLQRSLVSDRLERITAGYNQARLEQQIRLLQLQRLGLALGIAVIVLSSLLIILSIRRLKRRKEEKLEEAEQMIAALQTLCSQQDKQQTDIKSLLVKELEISRQLTYLSTLDAPQPQSFLKTYENILGHIHSAEWNWEKFYILVDSLFDNFHQKLAAHPELFSEKDVQYLCLLQGGFRPDEIAFVMKVTASAVHKRSTALRKRFGVEERGDVLAGVLEALKN